MAAPQYENSVFVNCPLDEAYRELFEALVFAIHLKPEVVRLPAGSVIATRFKRFRDELPAYCARLSLRSNELTFNDYVVQVEQWLKLNARVSA